MANVSEGRRRAGIRFAVARAAPVSMFAAPGPTEAAEANVDRRRFIRAKPTDSWTIACSLRAWW